MEFTAKQIAPPKDWNRFEDLCRALFSAVWNDPYAQKNGRSGQPQHGVDIWGESHGARSGTHCIQCKGKDINYHRKVTESEFDTELAKAERFKPAPRLWILVAREKLCGARESVNLGGIEVTLFARFCGFAVESLRFCTGGHAASSP